MNPRLGLPTGVRAEADLLLAAASVDGAAKRRERIAALLAGDLDWPLLVRIARLDRLGALVYHALLEVGLSPAPARSLRALEGDYRRTKLRNLFLLRELLAALSSLRKAGIEAVPYKGPLLASLLYEDLGLRQFKDLDLVVRRSDLAAARALLLREGYRPLETLDDEGERSYLAEDCELHFERSDAGPPVELEVHWQVLPRQHTFGLDLDAFWERLTPHELAGVEVKVFPPEDLLLLLSVHHGEKHQWRRLRWIGDVARLLAREPDLDWDLVMERASAIGREHTVRLGAYLAWVLLDAPLPAPIRDRALSDRRIASEAGLVRGRLFREDGGLPPYREWRHYLVSHSERIHRRGIAPRGRGGRLRYLSAVLRPEWSDRQAFRLPAGLAFLYYVVRPARLFARHRARILKRI